MPFVGAPGVLAELWPLSASSDWYAKHAGWATNYCCCIRRAQKHISRLPFARSARDSLLNPNNTTRLQYARANASNPCLALPGVHVWRRWADAMPTLDLGVYPRTLASALVELADERVWPGGARAKRFLRAHAEYATGRHARRLRPAPRFDAAKFEHEGYARLTHQMANKGAMTKRTLEWAHAVAARLTVSATPPNRHTLPRWRAVRWARTSWPTTSGSCLALSWRRCARASSPRPSATKHCASRPRPSNNILYPMTQGTHGHPHDLGCCRWRRQSSFYACLRRQGHGGKADKVFNHSHERAAGRMSMYRYCCLIGTRWWQTLARLRGL